MGTKLLKKNLLISSSDLYDWGWALGFLEGEGTLAFDIHIKKVENPPKTGRVWSIGISPKMSIRISVDDFEALVWFHDLLKRYHIRSTARRKHFKIGYTTKTGKKIVEQALLECIGFDNCSRLVELLKGLQWHTQKHEDFITWSKLIDMIGARRAKGYHLPWTKSELRDFVGLYEQLNSRRGREKKYTLSFLKTIEEELPDNHERLYSPNQWTEEEICYLKANALQKTTSELSETLHRSKKAVGKKKWEWELNQKGKNVVKPNTLVPKLTKEKLYTLYAVKKLTTIEIAKLESCSRVSVVNYLKKFKIPIRNRSEATKLVQERRRLYKKNHMKKIRRKAV